MKRVKLFLLAAVAVVATVAVSTAQIFEPVSWEASAKKLPSGEYLVTYTATIEKGWSIYDLGPYEDGPMATTFVPEDNDKVTLVGKVTPKVVAKKKHDSVWGMSVGKFYGKVEFTQKVKLKGKGPVDFIMNVEWQACDATSCVAPTDEDLEVTLK